MLLYSGFIDLKEQTEEVEGKQLIDQLMWEGLDHVA